MQLEASLGKSKCETPSIKQKKKKKKKKKKQKLVSWLKQ
jgi:hypothetical protein